MADWDANSPALHRNLQELGQRIAADRYPLSSDTIRAWQALIMRGLEPTGGEPLGAYRGEAGLEDYDVEVGGFPGAPAERVAAELAVFDRTLAAQLDEMDRTVRREHLHEDATGDTVTAVIILCTWAHGADPREQHRPAIRSPRVHAGASPARRRSATQ